MTTAMPTLEPTQRCESCGRPVRNRVAVSAQRGRGVTMMACYMCTARLTDLRWKRIQPESGSGTDTSRGNNEY